METCKWDAIRQCYDMPEEVTLYREVAPNVTSVKNYRLNAAKNDVTLTNSLLCMEPLDIVSSRLLAIK